MPGHPRLSIANKAKTWMPGTTNPLATHLSKRRRRAGGDHFARFAADAAEAMRAAAFEIIGVAGIEDAAFVVDGDLEPARDHDAAFLAVMSQRHPAGVAARLVALFQDLQAPAEQIVPDLAEGDRLLADFGQFVGAIEGLARPLRLDREELGKPHRQAVEDALERADGGVHLVRFDQRDRRIGHAGAFCEFALGELVTGPNEAESPTDIDAHAFSLLQVFRIEQIWPNRISKINGLQGRRKGLVVTSRAWPGAVLSCQQRS